MIFKWNITGRSETLKLKFTWYFHHTSCREPARKLQENLLMYVGGIKCESYCYQSPLTRRSQGRNFGSYSIDNSKRENGRKHNSLISGLCVEHKKYHPVVQESLHFGYVSTIILFWNVFRFFSAKLLILKSKYFLFNYIFSTSTTISLRLEYTYNLTNLTIS